MHTPQGRRPSNRSNRFQVADEVNQILSPAAYRGPFWCTDNPTSYLHIPQERPQNPFTSAAGNVIQELRYTDARVNSDWPFRLFGNGSVGSQMLLGIPRVHELRHAQFLEASSAVWPFETGWAPADGQWNLTGKHIIHAEIYPSVQPALPDPVLDRGQVRAMWTWARNTDLQDQLQHHMSIPTGIQAGADDDLVIRTEEGWILHCGLRVLSRTGP
jgi:precorrin-8X/cobalt-precorrin-8 methylmutase